MSNSLSSINLSVLSFALSSWLDGSAQLHRSLILFPLGARNGHNVNDRSGSSYNDVQDQQESLSDRCWKWLTRPVKELDEAEKALVGALDVSSSVLLLKLLGSGPIFPFFLNPLSITLALPRKLSQTIGPVKWTRIVLLCSILSILHEAQRTSIVAGLAWLRHRRAASKISNLGEIILKGERLEPTSDSEDEEECVICSGGRTDVPASMTDSISSLPPLSSSTEPPNVHSQGPLEAFCMHAPSKHPMHRECFIAWKDAYHDTRSSSHPIITLVSDDGASPRPGTWQWESTQAILSGLGQSILRSAYFVPLLPTQLDAERLVEESPVVDSIFTLSCSSSDSKLGELVSSWPPCPGCRSAVKMIFTRKALIHNASDSRGQFARMLHVWFKTWKQLVSGRTLLVKTATQVLFAIFLVSVMRIRKAHSRHMLATHRVL